MDENETKIYVSYYITMGVVGLLAASTQNGCMAQVSERMTLILRSRMFESLMHREIAFFDKAENKVGTLTTKLEEESIVLGRAFGETLGKQIQLISVICVGLILGFWSACFPLTVGVSAIKIC